MLSHKSPNIRWTSVCTALLVSVASAPLQCVFTTGQVQAAELRDSVKFDIEAQALDTALLRFSKQAGIQVLATAGTLVGKKTAGVRGEFVAERALAALLKGSGLSYRTISSRAVTIDVPGGKTTSALQEVIRVAQEGERSDADQSSADEQQKSGKGGKSASGVEEMIVEDTKIKPFTDANRDLPRGINDPQPYYIFDSKQIERSGAINIQDFLRQRLTMETTFETNALMVPTESTSKNGSSDVSESTFGLNREGIAGSNVSSFNLRGLGANRTLVLVNGRRMAGVNYARTESLSGTEDRQSDLNSIPLSAVDRIEVLPSSASAIYGVGAIGGVINVILKRDYQGGDFRVNYGMPSHSNAFTSTATGTYGFSFEGGKSRLMMGASYSSGEAMLLGDREEYADRGIQRLLSMASKAYIGSSLSTTPEQYIINNRRAGIGPTGTYVSWVGNNGLILKDGTVLLPHPTSGIRVAYVAPGATSSTPMNQRFIPYGPEMLELSPGYGQFGRKQPLSTVPDVRSFNASFSRQMNGNIEAFADFQFNESKGRTMYAPNIYWSNPDFFSPSTNPFQNTRVDFVTTPPPSLLETSSESRSITAGARAHFSNGWAGELSYTRSESQFDQGFASPKVSSITDDANNQRLDILVDPVAANLNTSIYNIPRPYNGPSLSNSISLRVAGPVFRLPWGGQPTLSFGLDREKPSRPGGTRLDTWFMDGSPLQGAVPYLWTTNIYLTRATASHAAFAEGRVPLVTEKNEVPLVRAFEVQLVQRVSRSEAQTGTTMATYSYNSRGQVFGPEYTPRPSDAVGSFPGTPIFRAASYSSNNGTFALKYEPLAGLAVRASIGTAFIPPTYSQLIPDQTLTIATANSGALISRDPLTGMTNFRVNQITGGNSNLKPQRSRSKDIGVIYEPRSALLKGLRVNLQYYQIGQFDFISSPNISEVVTLPEFSDRLMRDPATQQITQVDLSLTNIAERSSAGVDASFSYDRPTAWGDWHLQLGGTKINYERRQARVTSPMIDYAGFPVLGGPAKYKASANLSWNLNHLTLGWAANWIGNYRLNYTPGDPVNGYIESPTISWVLQGSFSVPQQMYHNLLIGYDFGSNAKTNLLSGVGVQLNIQNVFNTVPPFDATRPPFYFSPFGSYQLRTYMVSLRKSF